MNNKPCRFCRTSLKYTFVDLGISPLCNSYLTEDRLSQAEIFYPLHAYVCENCFLVQLEEFVAPQEIFGDYAYFSSYSQSWLKHCKAYADMAAKRFGLNDKSLVVELASNDGYLLRYFKEKNIPILGVEPAKNVADTANAVGIPTVAEFFGVETAKSLYSQGKAADLLIGNNVLAHVPELNDFVAGMKILLKPKGTVTMEFPHLARLIEGNQFDTIYHEHFSYFSFLTVDKLFSAHGLTIYDVEQLPTHGGSLRIYARHAENNSEPIRPGVSKLKEEEITAGFLTLDRYLVFSDNVKQTKRKILQFMIHAHDQGKSVVGYGAPGKGNTLLNYCGMGTDFISYTVDRSPHKQGRFLPGSHIPILAPERINETRPDYLVILPWNLREEIMEQMAPIRDWGGQFVVFIPQVKVYS